MSIRNFVGTLPPSDDFIKQIEDFLLYVKRTNDEIIRDSVISKKIRSVEILLELKGASDITLIVTNKDQVRAIVYRRGNNIISIRKDCDCYVDVLEKHNIPFDSTYVDNDIVVGA